MRKKTLSCLFDNIFWYVVYLLPLLCFVIGIAQGGITGSFASVSQTLGFGIFENSPVYTALQQLFGSTGVVPLFASSDLLLLASYFISMWLVHLAVDVLLFIIRLAHHWLDSFTSGLGGKE